MNKYLNRKVIVDDIKFDSLKEARRYNELKLMVKAGEIKNLQLQPRFELQPPFRINGKAIRKIEYIADFSYMQNDKLIVEDVKSKFTAKDKVFNLKKKLLLYRYPDIDFREVI